jgi:hypothetical protein
MPNILLTTACNQSCSYCFAREKLQQKGARHMSAEDLDTVFAFLKTSGVDTFRTMGGEPTLHPQFREIVTRALAQGMYVDVLSNVSWPNELNAFFHQVPPGKMRFLLNVDHPDAYSDNQWQRLNRNLASLAGRPGVSLSFNLFSTNPDGGYVLDLAEKYRLSTVRLSFSLPVLNADNASLPLADYFQMSGFILDYVHQAEARGIAVHLDNAIPLCMFDHAQMGELLLKGVLELDRNSRCKPIIDIGPDLSIWPCFCLSSFDNRHLSEFSDLAELVNHYNRQLAHYQDNVFPLERCYDCDLRRKWGCQGGCTVFSMVQAVPPPRDSVLVGLQNVSGPCSEDRRETWRLRLADGITVKRYEIPEVQFLLSDGNGKFLELGPAFAQVLNHADGATSLRGLCREMLPDPDPEDSLGCFEAAVMRENLEQLLEVYIQDGFFQLEPPPPISPNPVA